MKKLSIAFLFAGLFVIVFSARDFSPAASGQNRVSLFSLKETPRARAEAEKSSVASIRESEIAFDFRSLGETESARLSFPLFDGVIYEAQRAAIEIRAFDDYTWRGKIATNKSGGDVSLTFRKGYVAGLIYAPNAVYEIVPKGEKHILIELNQSLFPECAGDIKGEDSPKRNPEPESAVAGVDSGDRIDVLVLYTTPVKNSLGGDAQAQVFAQQAIDLTNTAYVNSRIRQRVRLIRAQETTSLPETGALGSELSALRASADAGALRNTYKADLVAMLSNSNDACGIGYLMGTAAGGNPNNGFTVTSRTCAVGNLSFPHELGHNMGSAHNPENGSGGTFSYSFGHWVNGNFRTVMAYPNPCTSGCTRRPYFSNPAISFNGIPTGIENLRDNARSINGTADSISNYRYSERSLTLNNYNNGEFIPRNIGRSVAWSSDNLAGNVKIEISRDAGTTWETLIADTPNDGAEIVRVSGRPTRQARIRISSVGDPAIGDSSVNDVTVR
ncbi:MAG: zinc-dependent metalloprotease [Acidobacteriota bacterium]|nr:zinc-dependent metalloprotease [Acidobacteriota bacterium]